MPRFKTLTSISTAVLLIVGLSGCAPVADPAQKDQTDPSADRPSGSGSMSGRVAFIDPATGKLKQGDAGERAQLEAEKGVRLIDDIQIVHMPDGSVGAGRPGGFKRPLIGTLDDQGRVRLDHVDKVPDHYRDPAKHRLPGDALASEDQP